MDTDISPDTATIDCYRSWVCIAYWLSSTLSTFNEILHFLLLPLFCLRKCNWTQHFLMNTCVHKSWDSQSVISMTEKNDNFLESIKVCSLVAVLRFARSVFRSSFVWTVQLQRLILTILQLFVWFFLSSFLSCNSISVPVKFVLSSKWNDNQILSHF